MKQAIHIFKKDARGLAYEIAVTLLLIAAFAMADSRHLEAPLFTRGWAGFLRILLPLSWWVLTVRVIQSEAIPGSRQFWVTRPYSRKSLLTAKLLFLLVFISLPMAISDVVILHAQGFPVVSNAANILWELVVRLDVFILSAALVASLTGRMIGFIIAALVAGVVIIFDVGYMSGYMSGRIFPMSRYEFSLAIASMAMIPLGIAFQYARRQVVACAFAIGALLVPLVGLHLGELFHPRVAEAAKGPTLRLELDPRVGKLIQTAEDPANVTISIPVKILGIPEGLRARLDSIFVTLQSTSGAWTGGVSESGITSLDRAIPERGLLRVEFKLPRDFYEEATAQKLEWTLHISSRLDLYRNLNITRVGGQEVAVPGVGFCKIEWGALRCRYALRTPNVKVDGYAGDGQSFRPLTSINSHLPVEAGISPIVYSMDPLMMQEINLVTGEPVSRSRSAFDLPPIRLEDYVEVTQK